MSRACARRRWKTLSEVRMRCDGTVRCTNGPLRDTYSGVVHFVGLYTPVSARTSGGRIRPVLCQSNTDIYERYAWYIVLRVCTHRMSENYRKSFQRQIALSDSKSIFPRRKYRDTRHFQVNERLREKDLSGNGWQDYILRSILEIALVEFAFEAWWGKCVWCVKNIGKV